MQTDITSTNHLKHEKDSSTAPGEMFSSSVSPMKPITVYDLDAFFHAEHEMEAFRYKQVAVFEGKKGIVLAEEEAVHKMVGSLSDTVDIPVNKLPDPGMVWIIANYMCTISIDEIMKAPSYEISFTDFFKRRDYNPRCQSNFKTLLHSLASIEFDLSGYYLSKVPLSQQLKAAESCAKSNISSKPALTKNQEKDLF